MNIQGQLMYILTAIDPEFYGKPVALKMEIKRYISNSAIKFYSIFSKDLESTGFEFKPYNTCAEKKYYTGGNYRNHTCGGCKFNSCRPKSQWWFYSIHRF